MNRRIGRRIELGAGIAAGALALLALALLLFAPLLPVCGGSPPCPATQYVYVSALRGHLAPDAWVLILAPVLLALLGAAGAIADAHYGLRAGLVPLGVGAGLAALICLLSATGVVGALYFPATLALLLAVYGAFLHRSAKRTSISADAARPEPDGTAGP